MKWSALLIWIRPVLNRMGRDQEEKLQPLISKKKWTLSLEFWSTVNFLSQEAALSYQKPVKHFYGFSSRRGHFLRLQKSHRKKIMSKTRQIFFYFHRKFEVDANENETSHEPGSFISTQSKTRQPASGEWVLWFIRADNTFFRAIGPVSMLKFRWNLNSH